MIKVERPRTGDELRNWRLYAGDTSLLYRTINRNKKSIAIDLRTELGRDTLLELIAHSDVAGRELPARHAGQVGSGRGGAARSQSRARGGPGVGVRADRPVRISPRFRRGRGGVRRHARTGRRGDRPPSRVGVSIGDSIAGLYAAFGVVMALLQRATRRAQGGTGLGPLQQHIDVALNEAVFSMMESLVPDRSAYGVERQRVGGRMEGIAPSPTPTSAPTATASSSPGTATPSSSADAGDRPPGPRRRIPDLHTNAGRWAAATSWTRPSATGRARGPAPRCSRAGPRRRYRPDRSTTLQDIIDDEQYPARNMVQELEVDTGQGVDPCRFPGVVPVLGERSLPVRIGRAGSRRAHPTKCCGDAARQVSDRDRQLRQGDGGDMRPTRTASGARCCSATSPCATDCS